MTTKKYDFSNDVEMEEILKVKNNIKILKTKVKNAANKINKKPEEIKIMAVIKTVNPILVNVAIKEGIFLLGENKAQEFLEKYDSYLKENVEFHFIGHLQSKKVKQIIKIVDTIESVDSFNLAQIISKEAKKINKTIPILLEINIGDEESKFGFKKNELLKNIILISKLENLKIKGLMSIPPIKNVEQYFKQMQTIYIDISNKKIDNVDMNFLSMGMSNDFEKAIFYGANIVRIGSFLFGSRK